MQFSYALSGYRQFVQRAFREVLLTERYVETVPDIERYKQFLTRVKDENPSLLDPTQCTTTGLPDQWATIQFSRGPLEYREQDYGRFYTIRLYDEERGTFQDIRIGFGHVIMQYWLAGNTSSAIELCEALYYRRIFRIRSFTFLAYNVEFTCRADHSSLQTFARVPLANDQGSGFSMSWIVDLEVPLILDDIEGHYVRSETIRLSSYDHIAYPLNAYGYAINFPTLDDLHERKYLVVNTEGIAQEIDP